MSALAQQPRIAATPVLKEFRQATLLRIFPNDDQWIYLSSIYQFAGQLIQGYNGGYWGCWEYMELDNGGFFMFLQSNNPLVVSSPVGNKFKDTLSPEAASIIVNLTAYGHLRLSEDENKDLDVFLDYYEKLWAYTVQLPELPKIRRAFE